MAVLSSRKPQEDFASFLSARNKGLASEGVEVSRVVESNKPLRLEYNPDSPDAAKVAEPGIPVGYVRYPNVNLVEEMTDLISASRSYEANVTVLNSFKSMASRL